MVFELTIKNKTFLINEANILYVQLGDGSVPKNKALSVDICLLDKQYITIVTKTNAEAKKAYKKIKNRLIADMKLAQL